MAIAIVVNGERREVPEGTTLRELVELFELAHAHVAVELNRRIVQRTRQHDTKLAAGDEIELVTLVGGG